MSTHRKNETPKYVAPKVAGFRIKDKQTIVKFADQFAKHDRLIIGRARQRDVQVCHSTVSRQHCEIVRRRGQYSIVDRGSTNGLYVSRFGEYSKPRKVRRARLEVGMHIEIGDVTLVVVDDDGQCPIMAWRYSEFMRIAAAIYGSAALAAEYVGRSQQTIRRLVNRAATRGTR